jgi:beta-glucosidase
VKHFALYGASEAGRDYNTVDMRDKMYNDYFPPIKQLSMQVQVQ